MSHLCQHHVALTLSTVQDCLWKLPYMSLMLYATPEWFGNIYAQFKQFHGTNICIFIDWKFELNTIVFDLSPIRIVWKFSSIVLFRISDNITDNISFPWWPLSIANNEANLREISSKDFGIRELEYLTIAIIYTFHLPAYQGVFTCIMSFNFGKWREHTSGTIKNTIT